MHGRALVYMTVCGLETLKHFLNILPHKNIMVRGENFHALSVIFDYQVFIAVHMCVHFHICLFTSTSIFALFKQCFTLKDFSPSPHSLVYTVSANLYLSSSNLFSTWCSSPFSSKGRIVNVIHAWILGLHIRTRTRKKFSDSLIVLERFDGWRPSSLLVSTLDFRTL